MVYDSEERARCDYERSMHGDLERVSIYYCVRFFYLHVDHARSYSENIVSDAEFAALPPRLQEQVKRAAAHNGQRDWNVYYTPAANPTRFKRVGEWFSPQHAQSVRVTHTHLAQIGFESESTLKVS
jgi:hypothetical protein